MTIHSIQPSHEDPARVDETPATPGLADALQVSMTDPDVMPRAKDNHAKSTPNFAVRTWSLDTRGFGLVLIVIVICTISVAAISIADLMGMAA